MVSGLSIKVPTLSSVTDQFISGSNQYISEGDSLMSIKFEDIQNRYQCFGINSDSMNKEKMLLNQSSSQEMTFIPNLDDSDIQIKIETPSNFLSRRGSIVLPDFRR